MWTRAELKDNAKKFFKYNYWKMVLVSLVTRLRLLIMAHHKEPLCSHMQRIQQKYGHSHTD